VITEGTALEAVEEDEFAGAFRDDEFLASIDLDNLRPQTSMAPDAGATTSAQVPSSATSATCVPTLRDALVEVKKEFIH